MGNPRSPRWLFKFLSPLIGLLLSFLLVEGALRLFQIRSDASLFTRDPVLGWALRPGAQGWIVSEGEAYVRINQKGQRDKERNLRKPDDSFRIVVLGDSVVEARQVDRDKTFCSVVETSMPGCLPSSYARLEVLNFGVPGYGTAQEILILRQRVWEYSPDLVVLGIYLGNDLHDNHRNLNYNGAERCPFFVYLDGELVLDGRNRSHPSLQPEAIRTRNLLAELVNRFWSLLWLRRTALSLPKLLRDEQPEPSTSEMESALPRDHVQTLSYRVPEHPWAEESWRVLEGLIRSMARDVREHDADFVLLNFPMMMQIHPRATARQVFVNEYGLPGLDYPNRRLRAFARSEQIPLLDLTDELSGYALENDAYLTGFRNTKPGEGHFNELGHRLIAKSMGAFLCRHLAGDSPPAPAPGARRLETGR